MRLRFSILLSLAACTGTGEVDGGKEALEEDPDCDLLTYFVDADGDGFGAGEEQAACELPSTAVSQSGDCDDQASAIFPGAPDNAYDGVDADCAGDDDFDRDADGVDGGEAGVDCDDSDPNVFPGAGEACDGVDNDCDALVDEADPDLSTAELVDAYPDEDGDGYGATELGSSLCEIGDGWTATPGDCDDDRFEVNPDGQEICNGGIDDDCDGSADLADTDVDLSSAPEWFLDADRDGHGSTSSLGISCEAPRSDASILADDCDDGQEDVYPDAPEVCNGGRDDDCDDLADMDDPSLDYATTLTLWSDTDGDGYGAGTSFSACEQESGQATVEGDCDDGDASVNPAATETCAGVGDEDCDGLLDDGDPSIVYAPTDRYYADADRDGFGVSGSDVFTCSPTTDMSSVAGDCDDTQSTISPAATEVCNGGIDDDCDGTSDDSDSSLLLSSRASWYTDADSDGYGVGSPVRACAAPSGRVANSTDCNDTNPTVNPAATEVCNSGADDDCDGLSDDADSSLDLSTRSTWYRDSDGDNYGNAGSTTLACARPTSYVSNNIDCDDARPTINPAATEVCNAGIDDDCDALADDADPSTSSVTMTTYYPDVDLDGFGDMAASASRACVVPSGSVSNDWDCDDSTSSIQPGASELHNAQDDDCDEYVDEDYVMSGAATLYITEIYYRPLSSVGDTYGEWVEVYNPGSVDVVMDAAWRFADNIGQFVPGLTTPLVVPAGDYAVLVRTIDSALNGGVTYRASFPYAAWSSSSGISLGNGSSGSSIRADILTLQYNNPDDGASSWTVIDTVEYWNNFYSWPTISTPTSSAYSVQLSFERLSAYPSNNNLGSNWCKPTTAVAFGTTSGQYGTPGADNEDCSP